MKIIYSLLLLFCCNYLHAQNPLQILITASCQQVSGTYNFVNILNGKNQYFQTFTFSGQTENIRLGYNGSIWVLYRNNDLADVGFFNNNVPAGLFPPLTGWQLNPPNGCTSGTMVISNNLEVEGFSKVRFSIYPNPATSFLKITNNENNDIFKYQIFDINGRLVSNGSTSEIIDISGLQTGIYVLKSEQETYKFVKL